MLKASVVFWKKGTKDPIPLLDATLRKLVMDYRVGLVQILSSKKDIPRKGTVDHRMELSRR